MHPDGPPPPPPSRPATDTTVFHDAFAFAPGAPAAPRSRTPLLVGAAAGVVLLLVAVGVVAAVVTGGADPAPAVPVAAPVAPAAGVAATATAAVASTPCSSAPSGTVTSVTPSGGGLSVTLRLASSCAGGQVLAAAGTGVTVVGSGTTVAAGRVDLAAAPLSVPAGGSATVQVLFPAGSFWVVPTSAGALTAAVTSAAGARSDAAGASASRSVTAAPDPSAAPDPGAALALQAALDLPAVRSGLAEQWEPQLSSKKVGLVADGTTYDDAQILADHLALRARFPTARLLQAGQWRTFEDGAFWVTVSGVPSGQSAAAALAWCRQQGIDGEHCSATFVSTVRGPTGVSAFQ